MNYLLGLSLFLFSFSASAQKTIWSHAIGNWRNGPVVYITPVIETTEAASTAQLTERFRTEFPILKDVADLDVLLFAAPEDGEESRRTLAAKYAVRELEVQLLEPAAEGIQED